MSMPPRSESFSVSCWKRESLYWTCRWTNVKELGLRSGSMAIFGIEVNECKEANGYSLSRRGLQSRDCMLAKIFGDGGINNLTGLCDWKDGRRCREISKS